MNGIHIFFYLEKVPKIKKRVCHMPMTHPLYLVFLFYLLLGIVSIIALSENSGEISSVDSSEPGSGSSWGAISSFSPTSAGGFSFPSFLAFRYSSYSCPLNSVFLSKISLSESWFLPIYWCSKLDLYYEHNCIVRVSHPRKWYFLQMPNLLLYEL